MTEEATEPAGGWTLADIGGAVIEAGKEIAIAIVQSSPPVIESTPNPNGDGRLIAVQKQPGAWESLIAAGPRCRVRRHVLDDVSDFARFLNRHAHDRHGTEILVGEDRVVADFAPQAELASTVSLELALTAEAKAWKEVSKDGAGWLPHDELLRFLRLQRHTIENAGEVIAGLRSFGIAQSRGGNVEIDELGVCRAWSEEGSTSVTGTVPPEITISISLFEGIGPEIGLILDVEMKVSNGTGLFRFVFGRWREEIIRGRRFVRDEIVDELDGAFLVGIGELADEPIAAASMGDPAPPQYARTELPERPETPEDEPGADEEGPRD